MSKKIISYNVNGIRAAIKKGLLDWLKIEKPDVFCIQESKAQLEQIDTQPIEELGYKHFWYSAQKKGYSGVSIWSLEQPKHVEYGMNVETYDIEGRLIRADFEGFSVLSVYVPSASNIDRLTYKMDFCGQLSSYITSLHHNLDNLVICGDFNICHKPIDIHDPVRNINVSGFLPEEREWLTNYMEKNRLIDTFRYFNSQPQHYSWWSYRANARINNKGWRIDYLFASDSLKSKLLNGSILTKVEHSDHCPVQLVLDV